MSGIVKKYPALFQFVLAFLLGVGILIPINAGILPTSFFFLAAISASLAGIILTAVVAGKAGIRALFNRLLIRRVGVGWCAFAVFSLLGVVILGMFINSLLGLDPLDVSRFPQGLVSFVPFFMMLFITGGLGEEFGWRGFLLPRMQSRHNALVASVIVGILHGLWHVPMFFIEGLSPYQEMAAVANIGVVIVGYTLFYVTSWSILYTLVMNNTKGSLLLVCILHASEAWVLVMWNIGNTSSFIGLGVAMTIVAIIVVLVFGAENLSRSIKRYMIAD